MAKPMVIYHANCSDGWCAAWIMDRCLGGCDLVPASYGDEPPIVDNRTVIIVDFSYPRDVLERLNSECHRLVVLDHHKTAEEALRGLNYCTFDSSESGATLALKWCTAKGFIFGIDRNLQSGMEQLAGYVKDRDLWQWILPRSRQINTMLRCYPFELKAWDILAHRIALDPVGMATEGQAIMHYRDKLIESHVKHARDKDLLGHVVPVVECSASEIISDVLEILAARKPFAASWFELADGQRQYSLRSDKAGLDVGDLAKSVGGGGHKHAAGFKQ